MQQKCLKIRSNPEENMKKTIAVMMMTLMIVALISACASKNETTTSPAADVVASSSPSGEKVELQFFQYKPEAHDTFEALIKKFEAANPNIKIVQDNPPDASTVIKTKVAANEIPDIIAIGGDNIYASLAQSGVLSDITGSPELSNVTEGYVKMLGTIAETDKTYAIPYGANANGVIYNKKLFKEMGLTVPTTWDEFVALNKKIQAAGKLPFYFAFKDSWTTLPALNVFAADLQGEGFFADRKANKTTFAKAYKEAAEKYLQLIAFGQKDNFGTGYNDANVAFANGESFMYAQGVWAIGDIKKANPAVEVGVFPYPVTNDPAKNFLVSGVDQMLSTSATTKHPAEAKKFIEFLLTPESAKAYVAGVNTFSALKGISQEDVSVADLKPIFEKGLVTDFPDHYIPSSMKLDKLAQDLIMTKDTATFLKALDTEWDKAEARK
jgi:raffinose/stachyose/melibiose transport system substrate-binding protein